MSGCKVERKEIFKVAFQPVLGDFRCLLQADNVRIRIPQLISAVSQTEVDHECEVQAVLKDIPDNQPVVVVGDFNSPSHGVAPTTLANYGLTDLFSQLYSNPDLSHKSWDFRFRNGLRATWRIDYLFYSNHFKAQSAILDECQSSDHHLLIGRLDCERTEGPLPFDVSPDVQN